MIVSFLLASALSLQAAEVPMASDEIPRARDGDVAICQELDAARRAGTVEAYDLFLARHPDHRLAEQARIERQRIATRR